MNFSENLRSVQRKTNSLLSIGLDPDIRRIPRILHGRKDPILEFNRQIIEATYDLVCAYKLNLAFYEALGERCWFSVRRTLALIPEGIITIGDAKRGDIDNTSELYARSLFDDYGFDACTLSPYMGSDSVEPFLRDKQRGVFILAVTSNAGAKDFQHLKVRSRPLYEHVIGKAMKWNTRGNCGLVVGATRPVEVKRVRALAPTLPFLIPGAGAQGGDLRSAVRYGCDKGGEMAIINSSRGIIYASDGGDFARAARAAAIELRDQINAYRQIYF